MCRTIPPKVMILFFFLLVSGFVAQPVLAKGEIRYTKVNIHTQTKDGRTHKASYANYTNPGSGHVIIPAGSEIRVTTKRRKSFSFTFEDGSKQGVFEYHQPRMGMRLDEYLEKISSSVPISLSGLSKLDRKGVEEGKALVGMSKEGVMAALGYPAAHRTPSLDASTWIYWSNRFRTVAVEFDNNGKVAKIR